MMKYIPGFFIALLISATVHAQKDIINDPNAELRTINGSFTKIKVSNAIDLYLTQSETEAVAVSATENYIKENIRTIVEDGTLKIYYEGSKGIFGFKKRKMRAYVSFRQLEKLYASGASDVQVSGMISGNSLALIMSGASDFKGAVNLSELSMELSGASDVTIKGIATILTIESSGASDVKGYDLIADKCTAKASGASDVHITVTKELNANASGASDILYKGEAVLKENHSSGASNVSKKG